MMSDTLTRLSIHLAAFFGEHLMPTMFTLLGAGILMRLLIYYTIKAEEKFSREFEKRVHRHLDREYDDMQGLTFHESTEKLLHRTFDEIYNLRSKNLRRKLDRVTSISDRLFLVEEGSKRLIEDTLKQTRYYEKGQVRPEFDNTSKFVFTSNPVYNRVLGAIPMGPTDDFLSILPGLFMIGGLFGTFLGIMAGLPELTKMDVTNMEAAKMTLDHFMGKMAFSMNTSIFGIICSVAMTVLNTLFSPAGVYVELVEKYKLSLEFLWNDTLAEADPRRLDLDRHPEIRSRGSRAAVHHYRPPATLPRRVPQDEGLMQRARDSEHAPPSGRDWDAPEERIDVEGFRATLSEQKTALIEGVDPATHEPPAYGDDEKTPVAGVQERNDDFHTGSTPRPMPVFGPDLDPATNADVADEADEAEDEDSRDAA